MDEKDRDYDDDWYKTWVENWAKGALSSLQKQDAGAKTPNKQGRVQTSVLACRMLADLAENRPHRPGEAPGPELSRLICYLLTGATDADRIPASRTDYARNPKFRAAVKYAFDHPDASLRDIAGYLNSLKKANGKDTDHKTIRNWRRSEQWSDELRSILFSRRRSEAADGDENVSPLSAF